MSAEEKRLLRLFRALSSYGQSSLLDYAEFLHQRTDRYMAGAPSPVPLDIPRPAQESVVKAIRRLMTTYPMLDRDKLFHETSALMTRHVMHQRPAAEVIDELEAVFKRHYDIHLNGDGIPPSAEETRDGQQ
jgi:hypothetical protein